MFRNALAVVAVLALGVTAQAAIIIQSSPPVALPMGGLYSFQLTAVGTAGEQINTFSNISITTPGGGMGIHNVAAQAFDGPFMTPLETEHGIVQWLPEWEPYDTYFKFHHQPEPSDFALDLGTPYSETNDGSTSGMLVLPNTFAGGPPTSGFGSYNSDPTSAKVLTPANTSSSVTFMQVVLKANEPVPLFHVRVVASGGRVVGDFTGQNALVMPILPEPGTLSLLGLAAVACFGFIRRRFS